ncbi:pilin [Patescibacteria group bacterium]|nr:pilin [Patescibacteria group bacterium]
MAIWLGDCVYTTPSGEKIATIRGLECVVKNLLNPLPSLIALAALIMLIISGIRLTLAGSDPKATAAAWQTFTWAIVGIVLLAVAWLILVAIENFTGAQVTEFGFL